MPSQTLGGIESAFHVVWDWFQPDRSQYHLHYASSCLFTLSDDQANRTTLINLANRLNNLFGLTDDCIEATPVSPEGITSVTIHRTYQPPPIVAAINPPGPWKDEPVVWTAQIEGQYGTVFVQLPDAGLSHDQLQQWIVAAYQQLH